MESFPWAQEVKRLEKFTGRQTYLEIIRRGKGFRARHGFRVFWQGSVIAGIEPKRSIHRKGLFIVPTEVRNDSDSRSIKVKSEVCVSSGLGEGSTLWRIPSRVQA